MVKSSLWKTLFGKEADKVNSHFAMYTSNTQISPLLRRHTHTHTLLKLMLRHSSQTLVMGITYTYIRSIHAQKKHKHAQTTKFQSYPHSRNKKNLTLHSYINTQQTHTLMQSHISTSQTQVEKSGTHIRSHDEHTHTHTHTKEQTHAQS